MAQRVRNNCRMQLAHAQIGYILNFLNIILMLQSLLSCFACGDKSSGSVVAPQTVQSSQIKATKLNESEMQKIKPNNRKTDDNKSRVTMTTVTFFTSQTAPTKDEDDDQQIRRRIQNLRKKELPQRKAMESQFVKQNLVRSTTIYLIDKKWSEEYTRFLKSHKVTSMPPIDNQKLLNDKGQLLTNLKQKQDYFIVTEKIWKFVHGLYGGGPTIARDSNFPVITINARRQALIPTAIQNPLNLCFMISVLQMLLSVEQLNGYMLKKMFVESLGNDKKKNFHNVFYRMIKQYSQTPTDPRSIQLKQFASYFQDRFNPSEQHDAHQFLLHFTQILQQQMKLDSVSTLAKPINNPQSLYSHYFKQHRSMIDKLFVGQQQTIVNCVSCQYKSKSYIPFLQIVVSIAGLRNIQQCLAKYFQTEKLKDLYDCQNCKKKTKAIKSTNITKTPNYLILVLGKFSCTTQKKIQDRIDYSRDLNIKPFCYGHCGDTVYSLQSMIIHKGSRSNKGHYYTLSRRGSKNEWFYFNDGVVKEIQEKDVLGRDPYILVYERVRVN